jgi:serine/threonine protein kinase
VECLKLVTAAAIVPTEPATPPHSDELTPSASSDKNMFGDAKTSSGFSSDRFQVVRELGRGGMGRVFEVADDKTGKRLALKRLHAQDSDQIYRLKKEFRSLAAISHPHLATLLALINENGQWYFTMELIDGVDFLTYVKKGDVLR